MEVYKSTHAKVFKVLIKFEDAEAHVEESKRCQNLRIWQPILKIGIEMLNIIKLNGNNVKSVPNFSVLKHLRELYLSKNQIEILPQWLSEAKFVFDVLDLSNNPLFFKKMYQQKCQGVINNLNLSTTGLTRKNMLVIKYFRSNYLQIGNKENPKLSTYSNQFDVLYSDDFYDSILEINASFLNLEFSPDFSEMKNLQILDLSNNPIAALNPKTILSSIKVLKLSNCKIYHLPKMQDLINIQLLDLSHNEISNLPSLNELSQLAYLDLYNNMLGSFPDISLLNLIKFDVCQNYFETYNEKKINNRFYFDLKRLLRISINKPRKDGKKEVEIYFHATENDWECEFFESVLSQYDEIWEETICETEINAFNFTTYVSEGVNDKNIFENENHPYELQLEP